MKELESLRNELENERHRAIDEIQLEREAFEREQEEKMAAEVSEFEATLAEERRKEEVSYMHSIVNTVTIHLTCYIIQHKLY